MGRRLFLLHLRPKARARRAAFGRAQAGKRIVGRAHPVRPPLARLPGGPGGAGYSPRSLCPIVARSRPAPAAARAGRFIPHKSPLPQSPAQPGRMDGRKKGGAEKAVFPLAGPAPPLFLTAGEASRRTEPGLWGRQASGGVFPCRGKKKAFPCPRAGRVRPQKVKSAARTENLSIKIFLFFEERPAGRS